MRACAQGSQAQALTFTLHHLRTGVPSRGHLHIFERQIEKKEKGGNLMGEGREGGEKRGGGGEEIDGEKKGDREGEKEGKKERRTKPEDYIPPHLENEGKRQGV